MQISLKTGTCGRSQQDSGSGTLCGQQSDIVLCVAAVGVTRFGSISDHDTIKNTKFCRLKRLPLGQYFLVNLDQPSRNVMSFD